MVNVGLVDENVKVKADITGLSDDEDASFGVVNAAIVAADIVNEQERSQAASSSHSLKDDITVLSDDDALVATSDPALPLRGKTSKAKARDINPAVLHGNLMKLRGKLCGCSRRRGLAHSCFQQFSGDIVAANLVKLVLRLRKLTKDDMNREACSNEGSFKHTFNVLITFHFTLQIQYFETHLFFRSWKLSNKSVKEKL